MLLSVEVLKVLFDIPFHVVEVPRAVNLRAPV
jgi:hypothetical protein